MQKTLEHILISSHGKEEMVDFVKDNPNQFEYAIELALSDKQPYAWRATWIIGNSMNINDPRLKKHIKPFIEIIPTKKDGHQREFLKILEKMKISEDHEGYLFDVCMNIWEEIGKSPSVRITAFRIIMKIAKKYPELKNEIEFLSQSHYTETLSPGIKGSFAIIKKKFG